MNARMLSFVYGVVFILAGILGFTPNPIISSTGFFAVNAVHNSVHVILGLVFIVGPIKFPGFESRLIKLLGLGGIAVTVLGFLTTGNTLLGVIHVNAADHWLHLGLALVILASGFVLSDKPSPVAIQNSRI